LVPSKLVFTGVKTFCDSFGEVLRRRPMNTSECGGQNYERESVHGGMD
jgi:hypothetical protein